MIEKVLVFLGMMFVSMVAFIIAVNHHDLAPWFGAVSGLFGFFSLVWAMYMFMSYIDKDDRY